MKRLRLFLLATLTGLLFITLPFDRVFAASATLYLYPNSSNVPAGSYLTISIRENSGSEAVNAVQANLNYPTSLLSFVSISSSAAFSIAAQSTGGSGLVKIARGALPAVKGDQLVASVTFKALQSTGKALVSIGSGSGVVSASTNKNILISSAGGNYTLVAAAPTKQKDTAPPTISAVSVTDIERASVIVTWTTSEPATSEVSYGVDNNYGLSAVDKHLVTDHKIALKSPLIIPGSVYHFTVKSTDSAGNSASSEDSSFTTKGLSLAITVTDQNGKPVNGASVKLADQTGATDKEGKATLTGFRPGSISGMITYRGHLTPISVIVENLEGAQVQAVNFKIQVGSTAWWIFVLPLILLAIFIGGYIWLKKRRRGNYPPANEAMPISGSLSDLEQKLKHMDKEASSSNPTVKPVNIPINEVPPSASSNNTTQTQKPIKPQATPPPPKPGSVISPGGN